MPPRRTTALLGAAVLALLLALAAAPAQASACCMTAGVFGVGRLALWEKSAAGLRVSGADTLGAWSAEGSWRPNPAGYVDSELRLDSYGLLRLSERGQIYALVPVIGNRRGLGDDVSMAGGLGDLELGVRWELVEVGEHPMVPALGLTLSTLLPSGVRPEEAVEPYDADATGRSALGAAAAVSVEQVVGSWFARADVGGTLYAPFERADLHQQQRYGPSVAANAAAGGTVVNGLLLGAMVGVVHELPLVLGKDEVVDTSSTLGSAGLIGSWAIDPHWTILASASSGLFLDALGQNRPGRVAATLGVRYGHF